MVPLLEGRLVIYYVIILRRTISVTMQLEAEPLVPAAVPVPQLVADTALAELRVEIRAGLERHEALVSDCINKFIDTAENSVRVGWALSDAFELVTSSGGLWGEWVERNLAISGDYAKRLRRLAGHFCRDLADFNRRRASGVELQGLSLGIGPHLRQQLADSGFRSQNQMWRTLGLKTRLAPQARLTFSGPQATAPHPNGAHAPTAESPNGNQSPSDHLISALQKVADCLPTIDLYELSLEKRREIFKLIRPIVLTFSTLQSL
jgi:hypothetical protein